MIAEPFLTEVDPRARILGSRDGLASQQLWSGLGRHLVGNLTLTSRDIAGFRTLLIGYGLAGDETDLTERLRVFLRWEQCAAAARIAAQDAPPPLGARRASRFIEADGRTRIDESEAQILGDQRANGLWSLYHSAALASGLVDTRRRLTVTGQMLFEMWVHRLPEDFVHAARRKKVVRLRVRDGGKCLTTAKSVSRLLRHGVPQDRSSLRSCLVSGMPSSPPDAMPLADGYQRLLAELLAEARAQSPQEAVMLARKEAKRLKHTELDRRLKRVEICETVLVPSQALFDFVLSGGQGKKAKALGSQVNVTWPKASASVRDQEFIHDVLEVLRSSMGRRVELWATIAKSMRAASWDQAIRAVIDLNEDVMAQRGGAPWVRIQRSGALDVRLPLGAPLPTESDLLGHWRNPYYLPPMLALQSELLPRGAS